MFFLDQGVEPIDTLQSLFDSYFNNPPDPAPLNNDCINATLLDLSNSEANCNPITVNLRGGRESFVPLQSCDKNITPSDVWFKITTPSTLPENGIVVQAMYDSSDPTNVQDIGFSIYEACNASADVLSCKDTASPDNFILLDSECLNPDTEYFVKVWSSQNYWYEDGIFELCAYLQEEENFNIVWKEEFNGGLNGWTTNSISGDPAHLWNWNDDGVYGGLLRTNIQSATECNGVIVMHPEFIKSGGILDNFYATPYDLVSAEIVSMNIDLSNTYLPQVHFTQHFRGLNGNLFGIANIPFTTARGALFSYSIDGGNSWSDYIAVNDNLSPNAESPVNDFKTFDLANASGSDQVQIRFSFDGDLYYWAIDDVFISESAIEGCIDPCFAEYNPDAQIDNGSCMVSLEGCTNPFALNYVENVPAGCEIDCVFGDSDNDGINDDEEDPNFNGDLSDDDTDGDTIPNYLDDDDDGDGILTQNEDVNSNGDWNDDDADNDGIPDYLDMDIVSNIYANTEH